jgi:hypothetical protein
MVDALGDGADPFAPARRLLARLSADPPGRDGGAVTADPGSGAATRDPDAPPFLGGLVGFIGYDVGLALSPRPTIARDDQGLPALRLALHDWVVAWDRRTGAAWLGGRAVDGDPARSSFDSPPSVGPGRARRRAVEPMPSTMPDEPLGFVSNLSGCVRAGRRGSPHAIARGEIYERT